MAEHYVFHHGRRILPDQETHEMKLFTVSILRTIKNPSLSSFASMDSKDERGVEILVAWENPAQSAQSKLQQEEPEGRGEG